MVNFLPPKLSLSDLLSFIRNKISPAPQKPREWECCICRKALSGKVVCDDWGHRAHLEHVVTFCSSCDRMLSRFSSAGAYRYSDGRLICGHCKKIAVTDGVAANRSYRKVQGMLEKRGFKGIPKNVKVVLAHPKALSAHSRKKHTAGLTLSHYHFNNYKRVGITHQIGILFGLPRPEFEAVLAHELLHVWQHEHGVKFSPLYSEGLCELGGYLIFSEEGTQLAGHFLKKMAKNKDPVYGN